MIYLKASNRRLFKLSSQCFPHVFFGIFFRRANGKQSKTWTFFRLPNHVVQKKGENAQRPGRIRPFRGVRDKLSLSASRAKTSPSPYTLSSGGKQVAIDAVRILTCRLKVFHQKWNGWTGKAKPEEAPSTLSVQRRLRCKSSCRKWTITGTFTFIILSLSWHWLSHSPTHSPSKRIKPSNLRRTDLPYAPRMFTKVMCHRITQNNKKKKLTR